MNLHNNEKHGECVIQIKFLIVLLFRSFDEFGQWCIFVFSLFFHHLCRVGIIIQLHLPLFNHHPILPVCFIRLFLSGQVNYTYIFFFMNEKKIFFALLCFVLFCFVLFCFVLFCFVLFCFVLFCFALLCFALLLLV